MLQQMTGDIFPVLLLILIGLAFGMIATLSGLIIYFRRSRAAGNSSKTGGSEGFSETSFSVSPLRAFWRRPACWVAIRSRNLQAVQMALGLNNAQPCSWAEGLSDGRQIFVSPPFHGWILVFGSDLPDPVTDVDECFRFLLDLSRRVGCVQMFKADDSLRHHAWACMQSGRVLRGYAWAGKTIWDQGPMSTAEVELGLKCFHYEDDSSVTWETGDLVAANVEKVPLLASRWSVNPSAIDPRFMEVSKGLAGSPSRSF